MSTVESKKQKTLRGLKAQAAHLCREIGSMEIKIEFYAATTSDPVAYDREMRVYINRDRAALAELERLIAELEAMPVQLSLLAV